MLANRNLEHTLLTAGLIYLLPLSVSAQIAIDGSTATTLTRDGDRITIDDGDRSGGNLFHSFRDFSVPTGGEAFFNNAADVTNIFSRVTGGNISNIDGLIRANNTNLFLINPAGIIFGEGARLNIGGSFYGSTADSILFEEGEFSATDLDNPPLLTINAPIGLNFRDNPGTIVNNSVSNENGSLFVSPGATFALLGGEINFTGGIINAGGANIELGGLAESGIISLDENLKPSFPNNVARANISFTESARVNVAGNNGGSITVNANNIELTEASRLVVGIATNSGSQTTQAGDLKLEATGDITLDNASEISNKINPDAVGNAGKIIIDTNNLNLNNRSQLIAQIDGTGDTGNIEINATGDLILNQSSIFNQVNASGVGNAGDILINANSFEAQGDPQNRSFLISKTAGRGNAGNINLDIEGAINFETSTIFSQVQGDGIGRSGDIIVNAGSITLKNNSLWQASTDAQGDAGNITIDVAGDINLDSNNLILSQVLSGAVGDAGDIKITAGGSLNAINTFIIADSKDRGSSGDITIDVADKIILQGKQPDGVNVFPSAIVTGLDEARTNDANRDFISAGQGKAGNINISARELIVKDIASLSSSTEDATIGDAGNIIVNVDKLSITDNGSIGSFTENITEGSFDAGSININARIVELLRGGKLITVTDGDGSAGNINLNVTEKIVIDGSGEPSVTSNLVARDEPFLQELQGQTGLFANTSERATGNGGNIRIGVGEITPEGDGFIFNITQPTQEVSVINEGVITADSQGTGSGGQIFLRAQDLTLDNQGQILAITSFPQDENTATLSGEITLRIDDKITLRNNSLISAQALNGADGGNVDIQARFMMAYPSSGNGSDIIASAQGTGRGGNIDIQVEEIFNLAERKAIDNNSTNDIDASSEFGFDGNVSIQTPDVHSIKSVVELSPNLVEQNDSFAQVCDVASNAKASRFVIKGRGGMPPQPTEAFTADSILNDEESTDIESHNNELNKALETQYPPIATDRGDIYPARGVIIQEDGIVTLTTYPVDNNSQRNLVASGNCKTSYEKGSLKTNRK